LYGDFYAFFGLIRTPVVRHGEDQKQKGFFNVYAEMFLQICRLYPSLPDPRTLSSTEIRFYYEGIRSELKENTKPRK